MKNASHRGTVVVLRYAVKHGESEPPPWGSLPGKQTVEDVQFAGTGSGTPTSNPVGTHRSTSTPAGDNMALMHTIFLNGDHLMRMFRTLTCLSVLLCAVGCGDSPTVENLSDAGAGMQGGKSPIKQSPAERLAGTYVSDRAASIAFLESTGHYDADKLASFGSVFGKMEITYRGDTRTTVIDGQVAQHKFTIVDSGPNHVTIECK